MKVSPQVKEVDGKKQSSLFVNQEGVSIKHAYTKAEPNGMPDMEQVVIKGEKVWDDTKRLEFLHDMVMKNIVPKLAQQEEGQTEVQGNTFGDFEAKPSASAVEEENPF